jgi:hypothetical protein
MIQESGDDARRIRLEAEDYVDAKLAQFEIALQKILEEMISTNAGLGRTIDQVQAGRDKLRGAAPSTSSDLTPEGLSGGEEDEA